MMAQSTVLTGLACLESEAQLHALLTFKLKIKRPLRTDGQPDLILLPGTAHLNSASTITI